MSRFAITGAALVGAAMLASACGGDGQSTTSSATQATAMPTTEATTAGPGTESTGDTADTADTGDTAETEDPPGYMCTATELVPPGQGFFTNISDPSGIRVDNFVPDPPDPIPINDHSRLGFVDINGDHFDDIVAHSLFPNAQNGIPFEHLVFLNNGDGTFTHFSDESGLRDVQSGFFAFGDVDNDGDQDCFAGLDIELGNNTHTLWLNDGEGHFTQKLDAGVDTGPAPYVAGNAAFGDYNNDGNLDLFIGNGQTGFAVPDQLLFGFGDGRFQDVSSVYLAGAPGQPANGVVACDYDNDVDLDVFVANYGVSVFKGANQLWENDGTGSMSNVAVERGFASLATGNYWLATTGNGTEPEPDANENTYVGSNGFGIQCEDVNNDGNLDIYMATISHPVDSDYNRKWSDPTQLLINQGEAGGYAFVNEYLARGLPFNEGDIDAAMVDFDNDGRLDLAVTRDRKYEGNYNEVDQKAWFGLMHQQPDGSFVSVGPISGINNSDAEYLQMKNGQNQAWSDIDHDGDLDLLVGGRDTGGGRPNFLFRNDIGQQNMWLAVRLEGDGNLVNRDAIGARVTLRYADKVVMREVKGSRGTYNSMDSRTLHFGMGEFGCGYTLEVRWPDGSVHTYNDDEFPNNAFLHIDYTGELTVESP